MTNAEVEDEPDLYTTAHYTLGIYFNYAYYLGLSPYRFTYKRSNGYALHTNRFQLVIYVSLQLSTMVFSFYRLVRILSEGALDITKNPSQLVPAWMLLLLTTFAPITATSLWRSKRSFVKIFELCQKRSSAWSSRKNDYVPLKWNWMATALVHMTIVMYLVSIPVARVLRELVGKCQTDKSNANPVQLQDGFANITDSVGSGQPNVGPSFGSVVDKLFGMHTYLICSFVTTTAVAAAFTFLHLSIEFQRVMENDESELQTVIVRYNTTEILVEYLNHGASPMIFIMFATCLTYYSTYMMTLFGCYNWTILLQSILLALASIVAIAAAEAHLKMSRIKNWILTRVSSQCNPAQVQSQIQYTHACDEPIALKGCGVFRVTYASIGTALSLLITYTIVTLQLVSSRDSFHVM